MLLKNFALQRLHANIFWRFFSTRICLIRRVFFVCCCCKNFARFLIKRIFSTKRVCSICCCIKRSTRFLIKRIFFVRRIFSTKRVVSIKRVFSIWRFFFSFCQNESTHDNNIFWLYDLFRLQKFCFSIFFCNFKRKNNQNMRRNEFAKNWCNVICQRTRRNDNKNNQQFNDFVYQNVYFRL